MTLRETFTQLEICSIMRNRREINSPSEALRILMSQDKWYNVAFNIFMNVVMLFLYIVVGYQFYLVGLVAGVIWRGLVFGFRTGRGD